MIVCYALPEIRKLACNYFDLFFSCDLFSAIHVWSVASGYDKIEFWWLLSICCLPRLSAWFFNNLGWHLSLTPALRSPMTLLYCLALTAWWAIVRRAASWELQLSQIHPHHMGLCCRTVEKSGKNSIGPIGLSHWCCYLKVLMLM